MNMTSIERLCTRYLEGSLTPEQVAEFERLLKRHPEAVHHLADQKTSDGLLNLLSQNDVQHIVLSPPASNESCPPTFRSQSLFQMLINQPRWCESRLTRLANLFRYQPRYQLRQIEPFGWRSRLRFC